MTPRFSEYSDIPDTVLRELEAELSDKRGHREIVRREIERRKSMKKTWPEAVKQMRPSIPVRTSFVLDGSCPTCENRVKGEMFPPHDASSRCESGKRPHCTCDICF